MKRLFDMVGGLLAKKTHTYYMQQGAAAVANGDYADADREYNRALELAEEAKAHDDVAEISRQLAMVSERLDKLAVAETHYNRAFQVLQDYDHHEASADCLILLGNLYRKQRRLPDAEQVLQYSMSIYQQTSGAHAEGIARAATCLADCYLSRNSYAEAEKLLKRALEIEEVRGANKAVASSTSKLALAYAGQKKDADAEAAYKKSVGLFGSEEPSFDKETAHEACACYHNFAKFYAERQKPSQARPLFEKAMQLAEAFPGYLDEADLAEHAATVAG